MPPCQPQNLPFPPASTSASTCARPAWTRCLLPTGQTLSVANDDDGLAQLVELLRRHGDVAAVLLEASGRYERRAASAPLAAGFAVAVVDPRQARDFARVAGPAGQDRPHRRARTLAQFAQLGHVRLCEKQPENRALLDDYVTRRRRRRRRRQATQMIGAEKARLGVPQDKRTRAR